MASAAGAFSATTPRGRARGRHSLRKASAPSCSQKRTPSRSASASCAKPSASFKPRSARIGGCQFNFKTRQLYKTQGTPSCNNQARLRAECMRKRHLRLLSPLWGLTSGKTSKGMKTTKMSRRIAERVAPLHEGVPCVSTVTSATPGSFGGQE